jgi:hypothetical protein
MSSSTSTLLHDCVIEFMECLVHQLLAVREIYPPRKCIHLLNHSLTYSLTYSLCHSLTYSFMCVDLFERCTKYGISLWQCRHPDVSNYITQVLTNARPALEKVHAMSCISITVHATHHATTPHYCTSLLMISLYITYCIIMVNMFLEFGRTNYFCDI